MYVPLVCLVLYWISLACLSVQQLALPAREFHRYILSPIIIFIALVQTGLYHKYGGQNVWYSVTYVISLKSVKLSFNYVTKTGRHFYLTLIFQLLISSRNLVCIRYVNVFKHAFGPFNITYITWIRVSPKPVIMTIFECECFLRSNWNAACTERYIYIYIYIYIFFFFFVFLFFSQSMN